MNTQRNRILLTVAGLITVATIAGGAASLALFTSTTTVSNNAFTAGTVILTTDHPATAIVSFSNMAPGDVTTAPLLVSNTGSLALRYAVSSVATNVDTKGLKDQLVLTVKTGVTTCTNAGFATDGTSSTAVTSTPRPASSSATQQPVPTLATAPSPPRERDPLLPREPSARDRQRLPGFDDHRDLHLRRRADRQQLTLGLPATQKRPGQSAGPLPCPAWSAKERCGAVHGPSPHAHGNESPVLPPAGRNPDTPRSRIRMVLWGHQPSERSNPGLAGPDWTVRQPNSSSKELEETRPWTSSANGFCSSSSVPSPWRASPAEHSPWPSSRAPRP